LLNIFPGNYLISGGAECVLVLWQLDTGKKEFLPHLAARIENIVVSPQGSSYAVHLDDNSAMVLSTAEMQPTTYISGLQSMTFNDHYPKDALVRRVWQEMNEISTSIPAAINPAHPSQLLLVTGNGQQASRGENGVVSTPYVQIFDLQSSQSVSKQAVARANPADLNITSKGHPIIEPTVTKAVFSYDGKWLSTIDEWQPAARDSEAFMDGSKALEEVCRSRREIFLKFWEVGSDSSSLQLVSRIDGAHNSTRPEYILDLASDPSSTRFASVGGDGNVRLWSPRKRRGDGVKANDPGAPDTWAWTCSHVIHLDRNLDSQGEISGFSSEDATRGALDFSEDGSTLFVAFGAASEAVVYIIDTASGQICDMIFGMFSGDVNSLRVIGSSLIMVSELVNIYNVVSDELQYGLDLTKRLGGSSNMVQLAVNQASRSFALAIPFIQQTQDHAVKGSVSQLLVFSVDERRPQLDQLFPHFITSIVPSKSTPGYFVVDSNSQIWSLDLGTSLPILAQPLADLQLDKVESTEETRIVIAQDDQDDEISDDEMQDVEADVGDEDYDIHRAVVPPQRLADIFNSGPAFAMPPIEDIFYRVTGLFTSKPAKAAAS
jgi:NET1-associated nuclear protein 1 (U3 small nucleolar RNA-associated protein 17)